LALKRRRLPRAFTLQVGRELAAGKTPAQAAREDHRHPTLIVRWRQEHLRDAEQALTGNGHASKAEARRAELERLIGQLTMANARTSCCASAPEGLAEPPPPSIIWSSIPLGFPNWP
jgi:transposase